MGTTSDTTTTVTTPWDGIISRLMILPPINGTPAVPASYQPETAVERRSQQKPTGLQQNSPKSIVQEVTTAETNGTYATLGTLVPPASVVIGAMQRAAAWDGEAARAAAWAEYVADQRRSAWDDTLTLTDALKPSIEAAAAMDAPLAAAMPATLTFVGDRSVLAKKGAAKAKKNKKAAAKSGDATITQPAPSAPAPTTTALAATPGTPGSTTIR